MSEKDLKMFAALQLKEVRSKCQDLGQQIITHLIKCYIYRDSGPVLHWISEIHSWFDKVNELTPKGGKLKYKYIFEAYDPFEEVQVKNWVESIKSKELELRVKAYSLRRLIDYLNYIDNKLSNSKIPYSKDMLTVLIFNALEYYTR